MSSSRRQKVTVNVAVLAVVLCLTARPTLNAADPESSREKGPLSLAESVFRQAGDISRALHEQPAEERTESEFRRVIGAYGQVVRLNTDTFFSAESLARMAELTRELADARGESALYQEAIETYRRILAEHPHSSFVGDALIGIAQIYEENLQDLDGAAAAYRGIIREFPSSVLAREARAVLSRFEAQLRDRAPDVTIPESYAAADTKPELTNVRNYTGPDYARLVIDLSEETRYWGGRIGGDRIVIQLRDANISRSLLGRRFIIGDPTLLKRIKVRAESASGTTVEVEVAKMADYSMFSLIEPARLIIDVHASQPRTTPTISRSESGTSGAAASGRAGSWKNQRPLLSLPEISDPILPLAPAEAGVAAAPGIATETSTESPVKRIVIDPGHGGHDTGTISPTGLREKDLVLDVARRLRAYIKHAFPAVEVVLTRDSDRFIALEERTAMANSRQADLFISIHANASPSRVAAGVETFFLSPDRAPARDPEAVTRQNPPFAGGSKGPTAQPVFASVTVGNRVGESRELARYIQSGLVRGIGAASPTMAANRGVKHAPFAVLVGAAMPSVLAEVSFLSNPRDEVLLQTTQFRERIAASLFAGLNAYLKKKRPVEGKSATAQAVEGKDAGPGTRGLTQD
ncbi:MAG TPA: N-acetylmuramoyl-L-alanine amidase [Blastocatellia bacterium]|nr:N-acetylmuramoyl-L-alanine amidase [Blastocatellia bacterium]